MIWLYTKILKMRRDSAPSTEFKLELRAELLERINGTQIYRTTPLFRYALAPLALALLLGVGTTSYAYASPSVSEGHVLYPLKNGVENVEKNFYRTPEAKVYYQVRVLHRRADEAHYMIERGHPSFIILERVPQAFVLTEEQLEAAKEEMRLQEEQRREARDDAKRVLKEFREKVENANIDGTEKVKILEQIDAHLRVLESVE